MTALPALTDAVFAATTLGSVITRSVIQAKYAQPALALHRLQEARRLIQRLDAKLALAETAIAAQAKLLEETSS